MSAVDTLIAYRFVRLITTPFKKWDAFDLGIIDDEGNVIKSPKTREEKKALGYFERLVKNIKKIINTAPLGRIRISSLAIALRLLKEHTEEDLSELILDSSIDELFENVELDTTDNTDIFPAGRYLIDKKLVIIKEDLAPIDTILDVHIYEVTSFIEKERMIITTYSNINNIS